MKRLAVLVSHPIQYQAPLYRLLVEKYDVELSVWFMTKHGVEVTYDPGYRRQVEFDVDLISGYSCDFLSNLSPSPNVKRFWGALNPGVLKRLLFGSYDALLVHGYRHATCWLAFAAALVGRTPLMIRGEGRKDTQRVKSTMGVRAKRWLLGLIVKRSAACLYIGTANREYYKWLGAGSGQLMFCPYSVDESRFDMLQEQKEAVRQRLFEQLQLPQGLPLFLYVGKFQPWKRPLDLLRAATLLEDSVNVVWIGEGAEERNLESAIRESELEHVRLAGFLNQTQLVEWYTAADCLVLPSVHEPWGVVVNEAMAAETAVICSDVVGSAYDLVTSETGMIYHAGNWEELADCMRNLAEDGERLARMKKAARRRIQGYSLDETARGIVGALDRQG